VRLSRLDGRSAGGERLSDLIVGYRCGHSAYRTTAPFAVVARGSP
jgi:hypothetical protein